MGYADNLYAYAPLPALRIEIGSPDGTRLTTPSPNAIRPEDSRHAKPLIKRLQMDRRPR